MLLYKGRRPIQLAHLLTKPAHSIINQYTDPRLRLDGRQRVNGDGFGVGWYESEPDQETGTAPCIFTSVTPAWNNMNLIRLAEKIKSPLVFAHVRASCAGSVSESNCHPWQYGRLMFMHNGCIADFHLIKRKVQESLSDEIFLSVNGNTDSEWAFAVFLSQLETVHQSEPFCHSILKEALLKTIAKLNRWSKDAGISEPSYMNFAVTDGISVVCTRYVNSKHCEAVSMYYSSGTRFECYKPGHYKMVKAAKREDIVLIASEPLTFEESDWLPIPTNTVVVITPRMNLLMYPIVDEHHDLNRTERQHKHYEMVEKEGHEGSVEVPSGSSGGSTTSMSSVAESESGRDISAPSTPVMSSWYSSHHFPLLSSSNSSMSTASSHMDDMSKNEHRKDRDIFSKKYDRIGNCGDDEESEIEEDYRIFSSKTSSLPMMIPKDRSSFKAA